MKYKFNVKFRLEQRKDNQGNMIVANVPIIANITFCGKRLVYFVGYRIDAAQWNDDKEEVKRNNFNKAGDSATDINARLRRIHAAVESVFTKMEANEITPTPKNLRDLLRVELDETPVSKKTAMEYFDIFMDEAGKARHWTKATITKNNTIKRHLKGYMRTAFYFEDINKAFLRGFVDYLIETANLRNDVVLKYIAQFNTFMIWATDEGYNKNMEFKNFKPMLKTITDKIHKYALTIEEYEMLFNLDIEKPYLARVRDVFCFCCNTGVRYSDAKALRWCDVREGRTRKGDVVYYIDLTTQKTSEHLQIPLTNDAKAIIDRYATGRDVNEFVLPVISNQKYNKYLKELGQLAGMDAAQREVYFRGGERQEETFQRWEKLSSHVARRTFTSLAVTFGIPSEIIRSITGHHSAAMMDKYVKLNLDDKIEQIGKFGNQVTGEIIGDERKLFALLNEALKNGDFDAARASMNALCVVRGIQLDE